MCIYPLYTKLIENGEGGEYTVPITCQPTNLSAHSISYQMPIQHLISKQKRIHRARNAMR